MFTANPKYRTHWLHQNIVWAVAYYRFIGRHFGSHFAISSLRRSADCVPVYARGRYRRSTVWICRQIRNNSNRRMFGNLSNKTLRRYLFAESNNAARRWIRHVPPVDHICLWLPKRRSHSSGYLCSDSPFDCETLSSIALLPTSMRLVLVGILLQCNATTALRTVRFESDGTRADLSSETMRRDSVSVHTYVGLPSHSSKYMSLHAICNQCSQPLPPLPAQTFNR